MCTQRKKEAGGNHKRRYPMPQAFLALVVTLSSLSWLDDLHAGGVCRNPAKPF